MMKSFNHVLISIYIIYRIQYKLVKRTLGKTTTKNEDILLVPKITDKGVFWPKCYSTLLSGANNKLHKMVNPSKTKITVMLVAQLSMENPQQY